MSTPNAARRSEPDSELPAIGSVIGGRYRLERLLGEGGMGAVFAATNELTGKRVAIKWMLPGASGDAAAVARFLREARAAGQIEHPNVVDVYDVGSSDGAPFLVLELMRGRPLEELLDGGAVSPATAVRLLLPAMRGIQAAHEQGITHRDLKPDNLFVCEDESGRPTDTKVLDFGISKIANDDVGPLTVTGAVMGTPHYMAPEQIRGSKHLDARTDIYALGVICYRAVTGRLPFETGSFSALAVEIATEPAPPPSRWVDDLDPGLEAIILKALTKDPSARYQSVADLAQALEPFGEGVRFATEPGAIRISARPPSDQRSAETAETLASAKSKAAAEDSEAAITRAAVPSSIQATRELPMRSRGGLYAAIGFAVVSLVGAAVWLTGRDQPQPARPSTAPASVVAPTPDPVVTPEAPRAAPRPASIVEAAPQPRELEPEGPTHPTAVAEEPPSTSRGRSVGRPVRDTPVIPRAAAEPAPAAPPSTTGVRTGGVSIDDF